MVVPMPILLPTPMPTRPSSPRAVQTPVGKDGREGHLASEAASLLELLRIDTRSDDCVEAAAAAVRAGIVLLSDLDRITQALIAADEGWPTATGVMLCRVWQQLRAAGGPTASAALPGMRIVRTPSRHEGMATVNLLLVTDGPEYVARLQRDAQALCELLRLSLCDAADLELARTVLTDAGRFLPRLRTHAAAVGTPPAEAWCQLASSS